MLYSQQVQTNKQKKHNINMTNDRQEHNYYIQEIKIMLWPIIGAK